jgi:hypothetical protein
MNSRICEVVVICVRSDLIELPLCNSWLTALFFLRASLNRLGTRYLSASPSSQAWCQNRALWPFPIMIVVEALNRRRLISLHDTFVPTHSLESSVYSCHSQRRRNALPNLSKSGTPMHPQVLGHADGWPIDQAVTHISVLLSFPEKWSSYLVNFIPCPNR